MQQTVELEIVVRKTVSITKAEYELIANTHKQIGDTSMKIVLIKFIRSQYQLGLKEAKDIVDAVIEREYVVRASASINRPDPFHEVDETLERPTFTLGELLRQKLEE